MKTIELTQGAVALVDDRDYDAVTQHKWFLMKTKSAGRMYAATNINDKMILMHLFINPLDPEEEDYLVTDHKDGNGLNNQRRNLRKCTRSQNAANRGATKRNKTGYKGVQKAGKKFRAVICENGYAMHIGTYATVEDAARAYNTAAIGVFGEFACLNKLPDSESKGTDGDE